MKGMESLGTKQFRAKASVGHVVLTAGSGSCCCWTHSYACEIGVEYENGLGKVLFVITNSFFVANSLIAIPISPPIPTISLGFLFRLLSEVICNSDSRTLA